jgi:hypothetical protein
VTVSTGIPSDSASGTTPLDWSSSYSQYLTRSAAQSAKTLKLYQEALECVSQGKLAPTVFQDHFPRFVQAHAIPYSTKLAEVGARFLSDLLRLGASVPQPRAGSDADTASEPEITPPRFDPANPARWFEQLAEYAGLLNGRALKAYRAQLDRVAAGETTPSEVQQATSDYLIHQLPNYLQQLAGLYFGLLNGLNDVRAEYEEDYLRGVLATAVPEERQPPLVLSLSGPVGSTTSATLSVTNTTGERASVRHRVSDVRRADGVGPAFDPKVLVAPKTLELGPEEEGVLSLSLPLEAEHYDPDALYIGTLYVTGGADLRVEVQLRITATAAKGAVSGVNTKVSA